MLKPNDAIDLALKAIDAKTALATAEHKEMLADAKIALADLKLEFSNQKLEIDKLNKQINIEKSLTFDGRDYWLIKKGNEKDGPFCQYCQDVEKRLVRKPKVFCSQCLSKGRH